MMNRSFFAETSKRTLLHVENDCSYGFMSVDEGELFECEYKNFETGENMRMFASRERNMVLMYVHHLHRYATRYYDDVVSFSDLISRGLADMSALVSEG